MNFRSFRLLAALALAVFFGSTAFADIVTFQKGLDDPFTGELYAGFEDNLLINVASNANYADYNFGLYPYIGIGVNGTDNAIKRKELMRFDITSLADEYSSINSVTLRLYPYSVGTTTGSVNFANNLQLFRLSAANGDWVEGTKISFGTGEGRAPAPEDGSSCWNYRAYNDTPWASGTPGTDATDYTGGPIAVTPFDSVPTDWVELEFTDLSFINDWVAGNNSGMILRVENELSNSFLLFLASNDWTGYAEYWPQLVIDYTPAPGFPGDATRDGVVNELDAEILAENWLGTNKSWGTGDFNADGVVNEIDATIMAANWQATAPSGAVPEPGTAVLLLGGLGALLLYRRISA